ncbi:MAG: aminotransferase class IV [Chitinophagaceae bacterium]|nr:aminotransferase class IV [Chitinophagaceae bacterium]
MVAFINGEYKDEEKALLHVSDLSIQRGYAAFDFFRTLDFKPLFLDDYLERFFKSIELLRLNNTYSRQQVKDIIRQLIEENKLAVSGIRMTMTGGYSQSGYEPATANLIITQQKLATPPEENIKEGIKVITYEYQRDLPEIKSINYLMGVWLQQKVKEQQASDVLYYKNNIVTEFPRSNLFVISKDGELITNQKNILEGITRKKVLELAAGEFPVIIKDITLDEINNAAELFMTSTTKRILPVTRVNDKIIGSGNAGQITTALHTSFLSFERSAVK